MRLVAGLVVGLICASAFAAEAVQRTLSFEDRVRAQAAIDRVYYSHQSGATKRFEEAVPRSVLENKVRKYLEQSAALQHYWKTAVTDESLQAELSRMTENSRMPERLSELFAALGDDPFLIKECLARPALADRLTHNFYGMDPGMHVKERTIADGLRRRLVDGMLDPAAEHPNRTVTELVVDDGEAASPMSQRQLQQPVSRERFIERRSELPTRVAQVSAVEENRDAFSVSVILSETATSLRVANYSVRKTTWDAWWAGARAAVAGSTVQAVASGQSVQLFAQPNRKLKRGVACTGGGWHNGQLDDAPPVPDLRYYHTAVWTGSEMLIFGGSPNSFLQDDPGLRYDPATDTWTSMSLTNAAHPRAWHTAVWTGTSMVVWGGTVQPLSGAYASGGRYDPITDTWTRVSARGAPSARYGHTAVWTGTEMVVWGGVGAPGVGALSSGGRYNPVTDAWQPTSLVGAPPPAGEWAVWTGSQMIVAGGRYDPAADTWSTMSPPPIDTAYGNSATWTGRFLVVWGGIHVVRTGNKDYPEPTNQGARYNPATDKWSLTSLVGAPSPRSGHNAVWTGTEMLVTGGEGDGPPPLSGGRYDVTTDSWTTMSAAGAPTWGEAQSAVWTGSQMIVWGGRLLSSGGRYDPAADAWTPTSSGSSIYGQSSIVWTGNQLIVWSGVGGVSRRYDPATDSWSSMTTNGEPEMRIDHTAVWSGTEMLIWGGQTQTSSKLNSGGRYDPAIDAWSPTSTEGAPSGRIGHSALWTGTLMFVWGGYNDTGYLNTGARYDPGTDTWTPTSLTDAPSPRFAQTAVWSGDVAIVWGGWDGGTNQRLHSGARYDLEADTWTPTALSGAPAARIDHSAVWLNGQMIVWGGDTSSSRNSGGRYDPVQDSWSPTSTAGGLTGRRHHSAVSTGKVMLVWGGRLSGGISTGLVYDPVSDHWTKLSKTGEPRLAPPTQSAIWTGTALIVWNGGRGGLYELSTSRDADCDGDGVSFSAGDCDDADGSTYPSAPPICDGVVNDCLDLDWPDPRSSFMAGERDRDGDGSRLCQGDCDDFNASFYPGALQICDGLNNDCADPSWPASSEADADGDGLRICQGDCDDTNFSIRPGRFDRCDGLDNDCDGVVDENAATICGTTDTPCLARVCEGPKGCVTIYPIVQCDDGDPCTANDTCNEGSCGGIRTPDAPCDDNKVCTIDDRCGPSVCGGTPTDGAMCDDDQDCTVDDHCAGSSCTGIVASGKPCDDQSSCTVKDTCKGSGICFGAVLEYGSECDDGNPCTTGDRCSGAYCEPSGSRSCQDLDPCDGVTYCDPSTGECSLFASPPDCDDHNECTADSCVPDEGCVHTPNAAPCDDGDVCTVGDVCAEGRCLWGPVTTCEDDNPCTDDACNFATGCAFTPNAAACDDGSVCTTGDACGDGSCAGAPIICPTLDQCHIPGVCDPATGACSNPVAPDGTGCSDSNLCTTGDTCLSGTCTPAYNGLDNPKPRPIGYYKRLCDGPHSGDLLTDADAVCVAALATTFSGISTVAALCEELTPSQPTIDPCELNEDELLILALNICRARACTEQSIASRCGGPELVGQSLAESDHLFASASRDTMTCARARCLAAEINTGRAIERNTQPTSMMPPTPER